MVGNVGTYYDILTYQSDLNLPIDTLVKVPVGKKDSLGVIVKQVSKPSFTCKTITKRLLDTPIPKALLSLHDWMSEYYATNSGTTWQTIIPSRIATKPRQEANNYVNGSDLQKRTQILLNNCQQSAIETIEKSPAGTIMLHGITGSGKTEVYKEIADRTLADSRSVIILVPEISLTTQLVNEFRLRFNNVLVTHSAMTSSERNQAWRYVLSSNQPVVIIGPRSALFMPVANLGLVVIDECHEPSYRQETAPRYSAITVAAKLCSLHQAKLILGSATPAISDYYLAQKLHRPIISMNKLAKIGAARPTTMVVKLTNRDNFSLESHLFTKPLLEAMHQALASHRQVLLFHNRRGTAGLAMCSNCGYIATCPNCFTPLTLHGDKFQLICHICGYHQRPPLSCPDCQQTDIVYHGIGTKRIEEEAHKLFPKASIRRFDGDTVKGEAVQDLYDDLRDGQTDIIIGTQIIAKGLDLPHLAVVGIIQADAGLMLPDFSASERTFQLVAQACGRVGRTNQATKAIIQTYRPEAPAIKYGVTQNYPAFYSEEIKNRQNGHFPPYSYLLKLTCAYKTERGATIAASKLAKKLRQDYPNIKLLGPAPAFYERLRGLYRWQIIVRSSKRSTLVTIASDIAKTPSWQVELDPGSLIS